MMRQNLAAEARLTLNKVVKCETERVRRGMPKYLAQPQIQTWNNGLSASSVLLKAEPKRSGTCEAEGL